MAENIDLLYEKLSKKEGVNMPDINTFKERYNNPEGMDLLYSKMSKMSNVNLPEKNIFKQRYLTTQTKPVETNILTNVGNTILDKMDYINPGYWAGLLFNYADDLINKPEKGVVGENQKTFQNTFKTPETQELKEAASSIFQGVGVTNTPVFENTIDKNKELADKINNNSNQIKSTLGAISKGLGLSQSDLSEKTVANSLGFNPMFQQDEVGNTIKSYEKLPGYKFDSKNIDTMSKTVENTYDAEIQKVQDSYKDMVDVLYSNSVLNYAPSFVKELIPTGDIKVLQKDKKEKIKVIQEEKDKALSYLTDLKLGESTPYSQKDEQGVDLSKPTEIVNSELDAQQKQQKLQQSTKYLESLNQSLQKDLDPSTVNSHLFSELQKRGVEILHSNEPNVKDAYKDIHGNYLGKGVGDYADNVSSEQALYYGSLDVYNRTKQELKETDQTLQTNRNNIYFYKDVLKGNKTVKTTSGETITPEIANQKIKELTDLNNQLSLNKIQQNTLLNNTKSIIDNNTLNYQENLKQQDEKNKFGELHPLATRTTGVLADLRTTLLKSGALVASDFSSQSSEDNLKTKLLTDNAIDKVFLQTQVLDPYSGQMASYKEQEAIEVFDDEGNFNPYVNVPALYYNTLKTGIESEILGGIMSGGKMLSTALFKGADNGLTKVVDAVIEKGFHPYELETASLGRMAFEVGRQPIQKGLLNVADYGLQSYAAAMIPTYVLYGSDMIDQELKKGLSYEDAKVIGRYRAYVEGFTERLFPNEMDFFTNTIGNGTIRDFKQLASNEVYRNLVFASAEKKFGKEIGTKIASAYFKSAPAIKEALNVFKEESAEEIGGDIINSKIVDPIAQKKKPGYLSSTDLNFQNLVNTAIATTATMLPMGGTAAHQEFKNTVNGINHSQFLVGKTPSMYLQTALSNYNSGKITKEKLKIYQIKLMNYPLYINKAQKLQNLVLK